MIEKSALRYGDVRRPIHGWTYILLTRAACFMAFLMWLYICFGLGGRGCIWESKWNSYGSDTQGKSRRPLYMWFLDTFSYYWKLEFSELYCRPGQKPQVTVVSLNMVTVYIFLNCHNLRCVVPVKCLTFCPQSEGGIYLRFEQQHWP